MSTVTVFRNCRLLRGEAIISEDLWTEQGRVIDPAELFFDEPKKSYDVQIDCQGALLVPGFIDLQINGGFGFDFTHDIVDAKSADKVLSTVRKGLLAHGVTAFCPTMVTSEPETYRKVLPFLGPSVGGSHGAAILGAHLEGPFISPKKKGAHKEEFIRDLSGGFDEVERVYGGSDLLRCNARMVTLAPELDRSGSVTTKLTRVGIAVSLGHSTATLTDGETAVRHGARMITHLFNAMPNFHHRDPGLVGLLASKMLGGHEVYYGLIADGVHTHPAALRIAYRVSAESLCIVSDAITALGLKDGHYQLGEQPVQVKGIRATVAGTETLCGAMADMFTMVKNMLKEARCSLVEALVAASLHPAKVLGIEKHKGSLEFGADADFIMIDADNMEIISTWIAGQCVYRRESQ